jgi:hypothetical protein
MIKILSCPILIPVHILGVTVGLLMFLKPGGVIEFQRRFYAKINWRIEPISMPKEIRNTKLMGGFLILASFLSATLILSQY